MHYNHTSPATVNGPFVPSTLLGSNDRRRISAPEIEEVKLGAPLSRGPTLVNPVSVTPPLEYNHNSPPIDDFVDSWEFRHLYEIRDDLHIAFKKKGESTTESEQFTHVISIRSTSSPNAPYAKHMKRPGQETLILNIPPPSRKPQQSPIAQYLTPEKLRHTHQFISGAGTGISLERLAAMLIPAEHDTEHTLALIIDQIKIAMAFITEAGYQLDTESVASHPKILVTVPRGRKAEGMALIACYLSQLTKFSLREVVAFWDADTKLENTPWHGTITRDVRKKLQRDLNLFQTTN